MSKALLLALLLPLAQDDPQVTYREGLFEEVDQGNLDKAVELYAKVLKSGAPDALKAKALFRTGSCHEKKGKKKDAEQAWRDVIERFPGAAETVNQARERLELRTRLDGDAAPSMDSTIQSLILDLGGENTLQRNEVVRKLVLIAEPAMPFLRKALSHKDGRLAVGAARVLKQLDSKDDLYEPLIAAFARYSPPEEELQDPELFGTLLYERQELRTRFAKDYEKVMGGMLIGKIHWTLRANLHADFPEILERWLANPKLGVGNNPTWTGAYSSWMLGASDAEQAQFVERLTTSDPTQYAKLFQMIGLVDTRKPASRELQGAVLKALSNHPNPKEILPEVHRRNWLRPVIPSADLIAGPLATWFANGNEMLRRQIIGYMAPMTRSEESGPDDFRKFLFERMADKSLPWEIRMAIEKEQLTPATPEERANAVAFGLDYIKEAEKRPELRSSMRGVVYNLLTRMPTDSKDLPMVLDTALDYVTSSRENYALPIDDKSRPAIVAASFRAIKRKSFPGTDVAISLIYQHGTPSEKADLGPYLAALPFKSAWYTAAEAYVRGLKAAPVDTWDEAWKSYRKVYDEVRPGLKYVLLNQIMDWNYPRVQELMKEAASSPHVEARTASIWYWRHKAGEKGIPILIGALGDKSEEIQKSAIIGLGELHALDAVPALILFLEDPNGNVRALAAESLKLIRKHYEERAEWKRWYDETKKALQK